MKLDGLYEEDEDDEEDEESEDEEDEEESESEDEPTPVIPKPLIEVKSDKISVDVFTGSTHATTPAFSTTNDKIVFNWDRKQDTTYFVNR